MLGQFWMKMTNLQEDKQVKHICSLRYVSMWYRPHVPGSILALNPLDSRGEMHTCHTKESENEFPEAPQVQHRVENESNMDHLSTNLTLRLLLLEFYGHLIFGFVSDSGPAGPK